jgi:hypothetical protein
LRDPRFHRSAVEGKQTANIEEVAALVPAVENRNDMRQREGMQEFAEVYSVASGAAVGEDFNRKGRKGYTEFAKKILERIGSKLTILFLSKCIAFSAALGYACK